MIRIVTPCRLHFGLLHVPTSPDDPHRRFGGMGMMIDGPHIAVRLELASEWHAEGPSAERALHFAQLVADQLSAEVRQPLRIVVEECPPEHVGLGVGTQLGLAIAEATHRALSGSLTSPQQLAHLVKRGMRSGIGVHGYEHGQLILDAGKHPKEPNCPSVIVGRYQVPQAWRVVLVRPPSTARWHGSSERSAFARSRNLDDATRATDRLARLALLGILPALATNDFDTFGEALFDFNRVAGESFAEDQGGIYASRQVEEVIGTLRRWGVQGVGQSSWGPTVFAFTRDADAATRLCRRIREELPTMEDVRLATPAEQGRVIEMH
jgi:beta-ribofuranosylaminobenzene 5'-phosphate synthase